MLSSSLFRAKLTAGLAALAALSTLLVIFLAGNSTLVTTLCLLAALNAAICLHALAAAQQEIKSANAVCAAIATGDFEQRIIGIKDAGEIGALLHAINEVIDRMDAYVRETAASMDYVSRNLYFRRIVETGMQGAFARGARVINAATTAMDKKVRSFKTMAEDFEATVRTVVEGVASASSELNQTAGAMEEAASATQHRATAVALSAEQALNNVRHAAEAAEELSASVHEIGSLATRSSEIARHAVKEVEKSRRQAESLQESAKEIDQVLDLVTQVAAQTQLLALNAAIEAARAGAAGRGFAVVAHEVKQLAARTAKSIEEIGPQVGAIKQAGFDLVESFVGMGATIEQTKASAGAIAEAVEHQTAATRQIAGGVSRASAGAGEVTAHIQDVSANASITERSAEEVLAASQALAQKAKELQRHFGDFFHEVRAVV